MCCAETAQRARSTTARPPAASTHLHPDARVVVALLLGGRGAVLLRCLHRFGGGACGQRRQGAERRVGSSGGGAGTRARSPAVGGECCLWRRPRAPAAHPHPPGPPPAPWPPCRRPWALASRRSPAAVELRLPIDATEQSWIDGVVHGSRGPVVPVPAHSNWGGGGGGVHRLYASLRTDQTSPRESCRAVCALAGPSQQRGRAACCSTLPPALQSGSPLFSTQSRPSASTPIFGAHQAASPRLCTHCLHHGSQCRLCSLPAGAAAVRRGTTGARRCGGAAGRHGSGRRRRRRRHAAAARRQAAPAAGCVQAAGQLGAGGLLRGLPAHLPGALGWREVQAAKRQAAPCTLCAGRRRSTCPLSLPGVPHTPCRPTSTLARERTSSWRWPGRQRCAALLPPPPPAAAVLPSALARAPSLAAHRARLLPSAPITALQLVAPDGVLDRNFALLGPGDTEVGGEGLWIGSRAVWGPLLSRPCALPRVLAAPAALPLLSRTVQPCLLLLQRPRGFPPSPSQHLPCASLPKHPPPSRQARCCSKTRCTATSSGPLAAASARCPGGWQARAGAGAGIVRSTHGPPAHRLRHSTPPPPHPTPPTPTPSTGPAGYVPAGAAAGPAGLRRHGGTGPGRRAGARGGYCVVCRVV